MALPTIFDICTPREDVLKGYDRLLRMQLDAPTPELRPSINKLLAHGKIIIKKGHYVVS